MLDPSTIKVPAAETASPASMPSGDWFSGTVQPEGFTEVDRLRVALEVAREGRDLAEQRAKENCQAEMASLRKEIADLKGRLEPAETVPVEEPTIAAYRLTRDGFGTWMYCGTTAEEVLNSLRVELESDMEPGNERSSLTLEPIQITQTEIDNMPEFPGW